MSTTKSKVDKSNPGIHEKILDAVDSVVSNSVEHFDTLREDNGYNTKNKGFDST